MLSVCADCAPDVVDTAVVASPDNSPSSSKESANSGALEMRFWIAFWFAFCCVATGFTVPFEPQPSRDRIESMGSIAAARRRMVMGTLLEMSENALGAGCPGTEPGGEVPPLHSASAAAANPRQPREAPRTPPTSLCVEGGPGGTERRPTPRPRPGRSG